MPLLDSGVTVVVGAQWGDEGKGKLVDLLAEEADLVCRCQVRAPAHAPEWGELRSCRRSMQHAAVVWCGVPAQGGNNAGHTVIVGDVSYDFHLLPR